MRPEPPDRTDETPRPLPWYGERMVQGLALALIVFLLATLVAWCM